jgi:hypothetical protein
MLPNQVPVSFFARGSKLLQDFRDLRQGRPFNERDASSASSALSLDCGPVSAAPSFGLILVGASLTRAASAELVRRSLFASDLILRDSAATKAGIYVESGAMLYHVSSDALVRRPMAFMPEATKAIRGLRVMKKNLMIFAAAALATTLAIPALAGPVGVSRTYNSTPSDAATIAELQDAAQKATWDGRNGNKNNIVFARKNYEINQLIDRLNNGQRVDPAEIDMALEPAHVW